MIEKDLKKIREAENLAVQNMENAAETCEKKFENAKKESREDVNKKINSAKKKAEQELEAHRRKMGEKAKLILNGAQEEVKRVEQRAKPLVPKAAKGVSEKVLRG